jgi:hypothetical protein
LLSAPASGSADDAEAGDLGIAPDDIGEFGVGGYVLHLAEAIGGSGGDQVDYPFRTADTV